MLGEGACMERGRAPVASSGACSTSSRMTSFLPARRTGPGTYLRGRAQESSHRRSWAAQHCTAAATTARARAADSMPSRKAFLQSRHKPCCRAQA